MVLDRNNLSKSIKSDKLGLGKNLKYVYGMDDCSS